MRRLFGVVLGMLALGLSWRPLNTWADAIAMRITTHDVRRTEIAQVRALNTQQEIPSAASSSRDFSPPAADRDGEPIQTPPPSPSTDKSTDESVIVQDLVGVTQSTTQRSETVEAAGLPYQETTSQAALFRYRLVAGDRSYAYESASQLTVLALMEQLVSQGFTFTSQRYDYGVFITAINGVANNPASGEFWMYTVNSQSATVGADQYQLKDDDVVEWTYSQT